MGEADLPVPRATLTENHSHNSWELTFERKPPRWVLDALKARKWRWSRRKACWYKRRTRSTDPTTRTNDDAIVLNFAHQFLSDDREAPVLRRGTGRLNDSTRTTI